MEEDAHNQLCYIVDKAFCINEQLKSIHGKNTFKYYVFSRLEPIEENSIYKKDKIYTVVIRTVSEKIYNHFTTYLKDELSSSIKCLTIENSIFRKPRNINKLYSVTPVVFKNDIGYWRYKMPFDVFEKKLLFNLTRKYNLFLNENLNCDDLELYDFIKIKNVKPIAMKYKNIKLLGDRIALNICENEKAQELAYFALGVGIFEMNTRGFGFVNGIWGEEMC